MGGNVLKESYKKYIIDQNLQYYKPHSNIIQKSFGEEIFESLNQENKSISPKFFYDKRGSELFDKICRLPEYYLTRTEIEILKKIQDELLEILEKKYRLVELGSGSSFKTRLILDVLDSNQDDLEYLPIDISDILEESLEFLQKEYPHIKITGIIDTYEGGLNFLRDLDSVSNLIIFLGSSIGNFSPKESVLLLKKIAESMKSTDLFLIGFDLVKDNDTLNIAYNDSKGITADFNLNVLYRINSELGGNFILENFEHFAFFNPAKNRIEMHIRSKKDHNVYIKKLNLEINFKKNETIHTEYSYKYHFDKMKQMLALSSLKIKKVWYDEKKFYCIILAEK